MKNATKSLVLVGAVVAAGSAVLLAVLASKQPANGSSDPEPRATPSSSPASAGLSRIQHLVVIYLENHSFDNLYGSWPGAEGLASPRASGIRQVDPHGVPYATLPVYGPPPSTPDAKVLPPGRLANAPFDMTEYAPESDVIDDVMHRFYQEQYQINGGKMDSFVLWNSVSGGQSMGYYPTASLPVPRWLAKHPAYVTVCDHFFHAAFGGSYLSHQWLISAQTPVFPNAPASITATLDGQGRLAQTPDTTSNPPNAVYATPGDGIVTPDGYTVNTAFSVNWPHPSSAAPATLVPQQTHKTIGDLLDAAGVSWAWYAGGWNATLAAEGFASVGTGTPAALPDGGPDDLYPFQYHHQPFVYYESWGGTANGKGAPNGKWAVAKNLQDEEDFVAQARAGTLRSVSFVKPVYDEHASSTTETGSEEHTVSLIEAVVNSPSWKDTVLIITYDEHGGWWDHVAPPTPSTVAVAGQADKWGPGLRVPAIVISPFAAGGVDSTSYDTTAILKLIESRWSLPALTTRDAAQNDLAAKALKL